MYRVVVGTCSLLWPIWRGRAQKGTFFDLKNGKGKEFQQLKYMIG